jgi:hypothetical protein
MGPSPVHVKLKTVNLVFDASHSIKEQEIRIMCVSTYLPGLSTVRNVSALTTTIYSMLYTVELW